MTLPVRPLLGVVLFAAVVFATITRPRGLPEWAAALAGGGLAVAARAPREGA